MKTILASLLMVVLVGCTSVPSGPASIEPKHKEVAVTITQPQPFYVNGQSDAAYSVAPSPRHVWIPGHYDFKDKWVWVSGKWQIPPRGKKVFVAPHWKEGVKDIWVRGYWQE